MKCNIWPLIGPFYGPILSRRYDLPLGLSTLRLQAAFGQQPFHYKFFDSAVGSGSSKLEILALLSRGLVHDLKLGPWTPALQRGIGRKTGKMLELVGGFLYQLGLTYSHFICLSLLNGFVSSRTSLTLDSSIDLLCSLRNEHF